MAPLATAMQLFRAQENYLQRLVADLSEEQFYVQPINGMNQPAWVIGHLIATSDYLLKNLSLPTHYGEDWRKYFGAGSAPKDVPATFMTKEQYLAEFSASYARMMETISSLPETTWDSANPAAKPGSYFTTLGILATHILTTHIAVHLGQLSAWRRALGLKGV